MCIAQHCQFRKYCSAQENLPSTANSGGIAQLRKTRPALPIQEVLPSSGNPRFSHLGLSRHSILCQPCMEQMITHQLNLSQYIKKATKWAVCPDVKTQTSLSICPDWWVFTICMKKAWVLSYWLSPQQRLWSDWADDQADLNLCWAHMSFCWFCHALPQFFNCNLLIEKWFISQWWMFSWYHFHLKYFFI